MAAHGLLHEEPGLRIGGTARTPEVAGHPDGPLVLAVHGGGFTSRYFDLPGFSLIDRAASQGCAVIALDRPGHGQSTAPQGGQQSLTANAQWISHAIGLLWPRFADRFTGVVLLGHSIGSAIVIEIAAGRPGWPLLGVAVSGIGLTPNADLGSYWESYPADTWVDVPGQAKDDLMFGPPDTVLPGVPEVVRTANAPLATRELVEINSAWPERARALGAGVTVPVLHRQGRYDRLWKVDSTEVSAFAATFGRAPGVDSRIVENSGHCIDFHHAGARFQADQVEFALHCGSLRKPGAPASTDHLA